jgi:hypothetical protein
MSRLTASRWMYVGLTGRTVILNRMTMALSSMSAIP